MKRARWESGCLSAGCAALFCELPRQCRLLLGLLGDLESWLGHSLPPEPPPPAFVPGFCSASVTARRVTAQALGLTNRIA